MRYLTSFLLKLVINTIILWVVLGLFFNVSFTGILFTSFILSSVAFAADVFILPNVTNFWATIGDFGLSFVGIWLLGQLFMEGTFSLADASLISAAVIAFCEFFYHRYMRNNILDNQEYISARDITLSNKVQTEFSKEFDENN